MKWAGLFLSIVMLSGCGNDYNGMYRSIDGIIGPTIVLSINGSEAKAIRIDPFRKLILSEDKFSVKERDEKLFITNTNGKTFIFARALDKKNLDCLNCGLGSGLPNTWQFFTSSK